MQNRAARILTGNNYDIPSKDVLHQLNWKMLEKRRENKKALLMYKVKNGVALSQLAISQLRTAKHLWIVWRDNAKWQKTLKVKIGAKNYKDASLSLRKSLKSCLHYPSHMSHDWCSPSQCPSKQSMHALRSRLGNG